MAFIFHILQLYWVLNLASILWNEFFYCNQIEWISEEDKSIQS